MQTVIGLFEHAYEAQKAARELMDAGFTDEHIDVSVRNSSYQQNAMPQNESTGLFGTDTSNRSDYATSDDAYTGNDDYQNGRAENDERYSTTETTDSTRNYDTADDDSFGHKVSRFFKNLFGDDDDDADRYTHLAKNAGSIVTVHAQSKDEAERAADILDDNGAMDVDKKSADYGYQGRQLDTGLTGTGTTGMGMGMGMGMDTGTADRYADDLSGRTGMLHDDNTDRLDDDNNYRTNAGNDQDRLNVIKEDIEVGKRDVQTGGVRLRSRIVERPVEETLRLREERVTVERTPVDRPATTADFQNFKEGTIEMTEYAEVPEVTKQARVVEEVKLNKEVNERNETISETARDTEVDVEHLTEEERRTNSRGNRNRDL